MGPIAPGKADLAHAAARIRTVGEETMFSSVLTPRVSAVGQVPVAISPVLPEVTLARTRLELMEAFRLLYDSYVRAGLVTENRRKLRLTPFHLLDTTEVFVAKWRGEVIATMTVVADGPQGLPMDAMYGDEVAHFREAGLRLAEVGCFADRRGMEPPFLKVIGELAKLVVQVASARGADGLVAATHPRHARFYIRALGFQQFAGLKECPYAQGNPAVALVQNFEKLRETAVHERLFGTEFPPEKLMRTSWDLATRRYLRSLAEPFRTEPRPVRTPT